jgi:hypothetical protein
MRRFRTFRAEISGFSEIKFNINVFSFWISDKLRCFESKVGLTARHAMLTLCPPPGSKLYIYMVQAKLCHKIVLFKDGGTIVLTVNRSCNEFRTGEVIADGCTIILATTM